MNKLYLALVWLVIYITIIPLAIIGLLNWIHPNLIPFEFHNFVAVSLLYIILSEKIKIKLG